MPAVGGLLSFAGAGANGKVVLKPAVRLIRLELTRAYRQLSQMVAAVVWSHSGSCPARAWMTSNGLLLVSQAMAASNQAARAAVIRSERLKWAAARPRALRARCFPLTRT